MQRPVVDRAVAGSTVNKESCRLNARPNIYGPEHAAIGAVIDSGWLGTGPKVMAFEAALAEHLGVSDVVALTTGTAALYMALRLAGVGPGHHVIVPSMTFCAGPQAIALTGAQPVFCEVDPKTLCTQPDQLLSAITPETKAVMVVHYGGRGIDLSGIAGDLERRNIAIIEDAAHSFGSMVGGRVVGSDGRLTCFSFDPIKSLTCGEGGALVPRSRKEAELARTIRSLGIEQSQRRYTNPTTSYAVTELGFRLHMSDINAAIGSVQLDNFGQTIAWRRSLWSRYSDKFGQLPGVDIVDVDVENSVPFNFVVEVDNRNEIFRRLSAEGIGVGVHYPPNHLQPAFYSSRTSLPVTEACAKRIMSLPFHSLISSAEVDYIVDAFRTAMRG